MKQGISDSNIETALEATTQVCYRSYILPLSRRYQTGLLSLMLRWLKMQCLTHTLSSGVNSLMGNTCAQVFTDGEYINIYPIKNNKDYGDGLHNFVKTYSSIDGSVEVKNVVTN